MEIFKSTTGKNILSNFSKITTSLIDISVSLKQLTKETAIQNKLKEKELNLLEKKFNFIQEQQMEQDLNIDDSKFTKTST